jgi:hypothetical protein
MYGNQSELFFTDKYHSCIRNDIELNLYNSLTACAMCHQLTPTDTMISTKVGKICIKCDIKMTRAGNMVKSNKTTKDPKISEST